MRRLVVMVGRLDDPADYQTPIRRSRRPGRASSGPGRVDASEPLEARLGGVGGRGVVGAHDLALIPDAGDPPRRPLEAGRGEDVADDDQAVLGIVGCRQLAVDHHHLAEAPAGRMAE